jgi:cation:H+ antiporter
MTAPRLLAAVLPLRCESHPVESIVLTLVLLAAGLALLYLGAEWLVAGAAGLASSLGVPQLLVGLTVVAYGTSAPELIVSIGAAARGAGAIALGNTIGSNIANLGLILGVSVLVAPARVDGTLRRRELPLLLLSTLALPLVLGDGQLAPWEALLLVVSAFLYTWWMVRSSRSRADAVSARQAASVTRSAAEQTGAPRAQSRSRMIVTAAVGLSLLVIGGEVFVRGATEFARWLGMSEHVVGLTVVALGTSLPELAASVVAARRGHADIAVGNVIGSNIFNVLLCLGAAGLAGDVHATLASVAFDLAWVIGMTLLGALFLRSERTLTRPEGAVLLAAYIVFLGWALQRGAGPL